jgi:endonuclease YncB( thermonuclease family)
VIDVSDGDTVTVLDAEKESYRVRLAGIDAPEKRQPFGDRSKQALSALVFGKPVEVEWHKRDRYGRLVGKILVAKPESACTDDRCPKTVDASLSQIEAGLAWHYKKYAKEQANEDRMRYSQAEDTARAKRLGLWTDRDPVPPWEWRKRSIR